MALRASRAGSGSSTQLYVRRSRVVYSIDSSGFESSSLLKTLFFSQKEWSHSFEDTGARPYCQRLTTELLKYVQPTAARTAAPEQPSAQMLSLFWPRNRSVADAHDVLFNLPMPSVSSHVSVQPAAVKRPLAQAAMSIALASRQHKRACRQFPSRPA